MAAESSEQQKTSTVSKVPTGVKIISVLYYIEAVFELLFSVLFFIVSGTIKSGITFLNVLAVSVLGQVQMLGPLLIIFGIVFVGLAVLSFFVGMGLWKGQKWSRIVAVILSVLSNGVLTFGILTLVGILVTSQDSGNLNFYGDPQPLISRLRGFTIRIINWVFTLAIIGYLLFSSKVKSAFS